MTVVRILDTLCAPGRLRRKEDGPNGHHHHQGLLQGLRLLHRQLPKKVYELSGEMNKKGYRLPEPVRIADCAECGLCDLYCPDFAIVLEKTRKKGKGKEAR